MKTKMRFFGSLFMVLGMLLGALGSHYLKKILSTESLSSFEVGLLYMIYQGLGLLILSSIDFTTSKIKKKPANQPTSQPDNQQTSQPFNQPTSQPGS